MPNLWTKTTQKISELFNGKKTKDIEFEDKVNEFKNFYSGLLTIKSLITNSSSYFQNLKLFATDVSNSLKRVYSINSIYKEEANIASSAHDEFNQHIEVFKTNVSKLIPTLVEMLKGEEIINSKLKIREEKREDYDHYDEKLAELYSKSKTCKNKKDLEELQEKIKRNEGKYRDATEKYLDASFNTFQVIQNFLDTRERQLGPVLCTLLYEEKVLFGSIFKSIKKFDNFEKNVYDIIEKTRNTNKQLTYRPDKYIRNGVQEEKEDDDKEKDIEKSRKRTNSAITTGRGTLDKKDSCNFNNNLNNNDVKSQVNQGLFNHQNQIQHKNTNTNINHNPNNRLNNLDNYNYHNHNQNFNYQFNQNNNNNQQNNINQESDFYNFNNQFSNLNVNKNLLNNNQQQINNLENKEKGGINLQQGMMGFNNNQINNNLNNNNQFNSNFNQNNFQQSQINQFSSNNMRNPQIPIYTDYNPSTFTVPTQSVVLNNNMKMNNQTYNMNNQSQVGDYLNVPYSNYPSNFSNKNMMNNVSSTYNNNNNMNNMNSNLGFKQNQNFGNNINNNNDLNGNNQ
jgi:hypothetical protein